MDRWMIDLMDGLRHGAAADVAGSRAAVDVSLSEALLNRAIAERLPPGGAVRELRVGVEPGRMRVTVRMARPAFLPPLTVPVTIERQPDLPASPVLGLRLSLPPGFGFLVGVGANFLNALPPGVTLEGERLTLDLGALLSARDVGWVLRYARALVITFEAGRVRIQGSAAVE